MKESSIEESVHHVFRTGVTGLEDEFAVLYGYAVNDLAGKVSFTDVIALALTGELPFENVREMLNFMLVLECAHGVAPSGALARSMIACGSPIQGALSVGALSVADVHGGAGQEVGRLLQEEGLELVRTLGVTEAARKIVDDTLSSGKRVPGFGHQWHHEGDPRAALVLGRATELGVTGDACALLAEMAAVLEDRKGRKIAANVDGVTAAVLCDMDIDWRFNRPMMIVGRCMTLAAMAVEEMKSPSRDWRSLMVPGERYLGPARRSVPVERAAAKG